tara:strand:+ start:4168 stop:4554 length:387 start_codon:yes stop_codon:yes gene_type:complete
MSKKQPSWIPTRRNKYNAKPTIYRGWRFDSKAESQYAKDLDHQVEMGVVNFWMRQVAFDLTEDDRYRADFVVFRDDGQVYAIDVKGAETESFRRTRRLWLKYGPIPLKIVKRGRITETLWDTQTTPEI